MRVFAAEERRCPGNIKGITKGHWTPRISPSKVYVFFTYSFMNLAECLYYHIRHRALFAVQSIQFGGIQDVQNLQGIENRSICRYQSTSLGLYTQLGLDRS